MPMLGLIPPAGGAAQRSVEAATPVLAPGEQWTGALPLGPGRYGVVGVATDSPARVRVYRTAAQRDADLARGDVDPDGDHGLVAEAVTTPGLLGVELAPVPVGVAEGGDAPVSVSNAGDGPAAVKLTLSFIRG